MRFQFIRNLFSTYETKAQRVLDLLSDGQWYSSAEVGKGAFLGTAFLYPVLREMERDGVIESAWSRGSLTPKRRLYRARATTLREA